MGLALAVMLAFLIITPLFRSFRKPLIIILSFPFGFATEAVNQSIERQKLGTAKPFEVYQAQQFNLQAQLDYLKIISDFNKAQYALKVAKGENL